MLKVTFDGMGLNDADNEFKERVATFTQAYRAKKYGLYMERAINNHEALIQRLTANTVGFHEASHHTGTVNKCGDTNCKEAFALIIQTMGEN